MRFFTFVLLEIIAPTVRVRLARCQSSGRRRASHGEAPRVNVRRRALHPTITVDDSWRGNPEAGVAGVLRRQGDKVYHTENTLWHCLFGLLFWDELFETGQLHSGFDWMPQCLKNKTFMRS